MSSKLRLLSVLLIACLLVVPIFGSAASTRNTSSTNTSALLEYTASDIRSCRYTQYSQSNGETPNRLEDLTGFEEKMSNANLSVYYCEETEGIRILNKKTGYVWGGLKEEKPDNMNKRWSAMANSVLTMEYLDANLQTRTISSGSDNVQNTWKWTDSSATCKVNCKKLGIRLSFEIQLTEEGISVFVDGDSIEETGEYKLQSVWILPFLGCVEQDEIDGYMFIPDGSGALIRYRKSGNYTAAYEQRIYGTDASIEGYSTPGDLLAKRSNDYLVDPYGITMPVFGIAHGTDENAFLGVVEDGATYATMYASPAGLIVDYFWTGIRFDYRDVYSFPVNKSGKTITTTQDQPREMDCRISYYLLDGEQANYSGMAVRYRTLLEQSGVLSGQERQDASVPLYLHVMAADVKESLLWNTYQKLTTVSDAMNIVSSLAQAGITNLTFAYEGWQRGGISGSDYGTTKFDTRLGSMEELKALSAEIESDGGRFYLHFDPVGFNQDQTSIGGTAALNIVNGYSRRTRANSALMYPTEYFAHPDKVTNTIDNIAQKYSEFGLSVEDVGNMAYGDYARGHIFSRQETVDHYIEAMERLNQKVALQMPNQYMWRYASDYLNMPVQNSQYMFETDSVPFLQMVLKGRIDYYAPYTNLGYSTQNSVLKMIEYGAYPSFMLMSATNETLMNTPLADYFSLNYENWEAVIREVYQQVNDALKNVEGASILRHNAVAAGVMCIVYDNGVSIYVNYTDSEFTADNGVKVPAGSYALYGNVK